GARSRPRTGAGTRWRSWWSPPTRRSRATSSTRSRPRRASSPAARSRSDPRLLRLRLRRRVAALHHVPQARALELGLEVPVRRLGGDPLLPHRLERRRGLGVELGDQVRTELLLRLGVALRLAHA